MTTSDSTGDPDRRDVDLVADDGVRLAATHYASAGAGPVTVIASATGVPQRYYARLATFLAAQGRPVVTFDGRGIARSAPPSLVGFKARFRDWGILDFPAVIDWVGTTYPGRPLHWIGHSYGGFALGLARNNARVAKLLGVATMTADVRLVDSKLASWQIGVMLFGIGPLAAHALGYVPGALFGGASLPKDAALEWARWCRTPGFLFGVPDLPEKRFFETVTAAVRLARMTDDAWVGERGVADLLTRFPNAPSKDVWTIDPARDTAGRAIGHLGFFRNEFRDTLWREALAWLDAPDPS